MDPPGERNWYEMVSHPKRNEVRPSGKRVGPSGISGLEGSFLLWEMVQKAKISYTVQRLAYGFSEQRDKASPMAFPAKSQSNCWDNPSLEQVNRQVSMLWASPQRPYSRANRPSETPIPQTTHKNQSLSTSALLSFEC